MPVECKRGLRLAFAVVATLSAAEPLDEALRHYEAGIEARKSGDNRRAAAELELAAAKGFRNLGARIHLLEAYYASRQFVAGGKLAAELTDSGIKSAPVLIRIGQTQFQSTDYRGAMRAFRKCLDLDQTHAECRYFLGLSEYLLDEYTAAMGTLQPLAHWPEARALRASANASTGNYVPAEQELRSLLKEAPSSPHAYINLALILLEQSRAEEALSLLKTLRGAKVEGSPKVFYAIRKKSCGALLTQTAAAGDPSFGAYLADLALQMRRRFHYGSATELLLLASRHAAMTAEMLEAAGASCLDLDQVPAAAALLEHAVSLEASRAPALALLGRARARSGDQAGAVKALGEAVRLQPDAERWINLGQALLASGQTEAATDALTNALRLEPDAPVALLELGRIHTRSGKLGEAEPLLRRAIEIEPDFYEAHYALSLLLSRAGKHGEARQAMARFQEKKAAIGLLPAVQSGFASQERQ